MTMSLSRASIDMNTIKYHFPSFRSLLFAGRQPIFVLHFHNAQRQETGEELIYCFQFCQRKTTVRKHDDTFLIVDFIISHAPGQLAAADGIGVERRDLWESRNQKCERRWDIRKAFANVIAMHDENEKYWNLTTINHKFVAKPTCKPIWWWWWWN